MAYSVLSLICLIISHIAFIIIILDNAFILKLYMFLFHSIPDKKKNRIQLHFPIFLKITTHSVILFTLLFGVLIVKCIL